MIGLPQWLPGLKADALHQGPNAFAGKIWTITNIMMLSSLYPACRKMETNLTIWCICECGSYFQYLVQALSTKLADSSLFFNDLEARTMLYTLCSVFISRAVIFTTVFGQIRAGICTRRKIRVRSCNGRRRVIEIPLPSHWNE